MVNLAYGNAKVSISDVSDPAATRRIFSPPVIVGLLLLCVFLFRLPSALVPRELNPDESEVVTEGMKLLVDSRPWIAIEGGSLGPLDPYPAAIVLAMGFKPGYILIHILASLVVSLQVVICYLTLRRLGSEVTAAVGGVLMVLFYGLCTRNDYLHYTGELLPSLLLMVGFYAFLVWDDKQRAVQTRCSTGWILFGCGLALGMAPWCKLQAAPITAALGLVVLARIATAGNSSGSAPRGLQVATFAFGAALTTGIILIVVWRTGAFHDFWLSYIQTNLAYAGAMSLGRSIENIIVIFISSPLQQLLLVALCGAAYCSLRGSAALPFKEKKWPVLGLVVYLAAALFAVSRVTNLFSHHAIFLLAPMTYISALMVTPETSGLPKTRWWPVRPKTALLGVLIAATVALYCGYTLRYVQMVKAIHQLSRSEVDENFRMARSAVSKVTPPHGGVALLEFVLTGLAGPHHWTVEDSNERIAALVGEIQNKHSVRSIAVWGWAPSIYVLTGIPPATRDTTTYFSIQAGPMQAYHRWRFLSDLRSNPPDLFIDAAVASEIPEFTNLSGDHGYESDPELKKFIDENYVLVDELTLIKGEKPVRFLGRRTTVAAR